MSLTDDIFAKRGTWQLFRSVEEHDLSTANKGHVDCHGRLWLRLADSLICTDGRHVIRCHALPIFANRRPLMEGFSRDDTFWIISHDDRLWAFGLDSGTIEEHTENFPDLTGASWLMTANHENILVALPGTILLYDQETVSSFAYSEEAFGKLRSGTISPDGDIWLTFFNGLCKVEENEIRPVTLPTKPDEKMWDITAGKDGTLWAPIRGGLLHIHDGKVERVWREGLPKLQTFLTLLLDNEDNFWIALHFRGTACVNASGTVMFPFEDTPGLSWPKCIVQDKTGAYWFIGVGNGILRYSPSSLNVIQKGFLEASALGEDGKLRFTAASRGFMEYDGSSLRQLAEVLPSRCFSVNISDLKEVYVTSQDGVSLLDADAARLIPAEELTGLEALRDESVHFMARDHEGCLWFSCPFTLYRSEPSGLKAYPKRDLGYTNTRVIIFKHSTGALWFISHSGTPILTYGPDGFTTVIKQMGEWFGSKETRATCCYEDSQGDLWLGSTAGCVARCFVKEKKIQWELELTSSIRSIRIDDEGTKWIGTADGLYVSNGKNTYRMTEESLLPSRRVGETYQWSDGRILILTELGLCDYRPDRTVRPEVFVRKVVADKVYVSPDKKVKSEARPVVSVYLTAVNMKPGPLVYQVRLVGHDDEWKETNQEEFHFENLPVGKYRFEARAFDQDLMTSPSVGAIDIEIKQDTREIQIAELENELHEAEDFAANIIRSINDAIVVLDVEGTISMVNSAALDLLGHRVTDMIGKPASILFPESSESPFDAQALEALKRDGHFRARERELIDHDGRRLPVMLTASCMTDRTGRLQGFVLAAADIAEYKALQAQVLHSQKMESLGLLAGGVAHDFKNLLSVMIGNAELILLDVNKGSEHHDCLTDIVAAGHRATKLCTELLDYSGKRQHPPKLLDFTEIVKDNASLLRTSVSRKIAIESDLDEDIPQIMADEVQLMQVVLNLVINAAEAIGEESGTISIKVGTTKLQNGLSPYEFENQPPVAGDYVVFQVTDTGSGMDETTRRRIFEPFFTTKPTGRGLGLAAIHGIVKSHGGAIQVESTPGMGTTFRIFLPA